MGRYSTNEVAKLLGTTGASLVRYMKAGKIPMPEVIKAGLSTVHSWSDEDVERVRKLLPNIANGRKTRYKKLREQQEAQPGAAVPRKKKEKRKQHFAASTQHSGKAKSKSKNKGRTKSKKKKS